MKNIARPIILDLIPTGNNTFIVYNRLCLGFFNLDANCKSQLMGIPYGEIPIVVNEYQISFPKRTPLFDHFPIHNIRGDCLIYAFKEIANLSRFHVKQQSVEVNDFATIWRQEKPSRFRRKGPIICGCAVRYINYTKSGFLCFIRRD